MTDIITATKMMKEGKIMYRSEQAEVRLVRWKDGRIQLVHAKDGDTPYFITTEDILADDWEEYNEYNLTFIEAMNLAYNKGMKVQSETEPDRICHVVDGCLEYVEDDPLEIKYDVAFTPEAIKGRWRW